MQLYDKLNKTLVRKIEEGLKKQILIYSEIWCVNKFVLNWFVKSINSQ